MHSSLPMLRAVGAGATMYGEGAAEGTTWSLLKVWIALETRQFVNNSIGEVENCVKYDLLSPNI